MKFNPADYESRARTFRDWNPASRTLRRSVVSGACLDSADIRNGDLCMFDTRIEIRSSDIVLVEAKEARPERIVKHYVKLILFAAGRWWFVSEDGLLPYVEWDHAVVGRLVSVANRRRELPPLDPGLRDAIASGSTPEYRAKLAEMSQSANVAIKRDGLDRTTVFRASP